LLQSTPNDFYHIKADFVSALWRALK